MPTTCTHRVLIIASILVCILGASRAFATGCGTTEAPIISATPTTPDPVTGSFWVTLNYSGAQRVGWEFDGFGHNYLEGTSLPPDTMTVGPFSTACLATPQRDFIFWAQNCLCCTPNETGDKISIPIGPHKPSLDASFSPATGNQLTLNLSYKILNSGSLATKGVWMPGTPGNGLSEVVNTTLSDPSGKASMTIGRPYDRRELWVRVIACDDASPSGTATSCAIAPYGESCPTGGGSGNTDKDPSVDCPKCKGGPINPASGIMRFTDRDPIPGGFGGLVRTYDSGNKSNTPGYFGRYWTTFLDGWAGSWDAGNGHTVALVDPGNGNRVIFERLNGGGAFVKVSTNGGGASESFFQSGSQYVYRNLNTRKEWRFDTTHQRVVSITDLASARTISITRDAAGVPSRVADSWGNWAWNLTLTSGKVTRIDVENRSDLYWTYEYDGSQRPQRVAGPGGATWRTYVYGPGYGYDNLSAVRDGNGRLIEGHNYGISSEGPATSSSLPNEEITMIRYELTGRVPSETVTEFDFLDGRTEKHYIRPIAGQRQTVQIEGGCSSCGSGDQTFVYDSRGRMTRLQGARGFIQEYEYGDDNRREPWVIRKNLRPIGCDPSSDPNLCRLDPDQLASAVLTNTEATRLTTYVYGDPAWPERPTEVFESSTLAPGSFIHDTFVFHSTTGEVLSSTRTGWTGEPAVQQTRTTTTTLYNGTEDAAFAPGGAFNASWLTLPQPLNVRKSVDGPRTDVSDVTSFVYYPVDASVPATWRGRLAAVKNALGHITRYENYDVFGNAERVVDANGVASESTHDTIGRVLTTTTKGVAGCNTTADPLCATDLTSTRTYGPNFDPIATQTSAGGDFSINTYDSRGRILTISRGPSSNDLRERIEYGYNAAGKKVSERTLGYVSGAWAEKTRKDFTFDAFERLTRTTNADSTFVDYHYDAGHNLLSVKDENHTSPNTFYRYDAANRLTEVRQTLGVGEITTSYGFDLHGNLISVTDPNGNLTTYLFDDFGQMLRQTSPVTGVTSYSYNLSGDHVATADSRGAVTSRTVDAIGRVTQSITTLAGDSETVTWTYDTGTFGLGRLASMTDPTGSTTYAYTRQGMLLSETKTVGGDPYTTAFQYDADGNRSRIVYPSGMAVNYTFDYADRPLSAASATTTFVSSASYLPFGPMTALVYGNGTTKTMDYDSRYRPTLNRLDGPGGVIAHYTYQHDAAGNITAITDETDHTYDRSFGYDDLNRLVNANTGSKLWGTGSYTYDSMGNMLTFSLGAERNGSFAYQGTTPKISSSTENGAPRAVNYDSAGNESVIGPQSFTYTPRNSLAAGDGLSYLYDGRGIRTVTGVPLGLAMLSTDVAEVDGGSSFLLTVTLNHVAPAGGTVVSLASDDTSVTVPASVLVPEGQASTTVVVNTSSVPTRTRVEMSGASSLTQRALITVRPPAMLSGLSLAASETTGGFAVSGTVTITQPAPSGGSVVALSSSDPAVVVPASVTVPAGQTSVGFNATANPVPSQVNAQITATLGGSFQQALTVLPPVVNSLVAVPTNVGSGLGLTLTVNLTGPAPSGGSTVTLSASEPGVTLPASTIVPAGSPSTSVVASMPVVGADLPVTFMATLGGSVQTGATVTTAVLSDLTLQDTSIPSPAPTKGTVTLSGKAPTGGLAVSTSSSNTQAATTQTPVVAAEGSSSVDFDIATVIGQTTRTTTISAQAGSSSVSRSLTVGPCQWPANTPQPPPAPATDLTWFDDSPPSGATLAGTWTWDTTQSARGTKSLLVAAPNAPNFSSADWQPWIGASNSLVTYVMLDPCNPPSEVMIQWRDGANNWNHRAFWGQDLIGYYPRSNQGALPPAGQWVRLEVPSSAVSLQDKTIKGISFVLYNGRAWFDAPGRGTCTRPPEPAAPEPGDVIWIDDAIPTGGAPQGGWVWDSTYKVSGSTSHVETSLSNWDQHYFTGSTNTLTINTGDVLVVWVYRKPCTTLREIMIQFAVQGGSWDARAFWGENLVGWGTLGTPSLMRIGDLPAAGEWVRLEIPASLLNLEGKVLNGMSFLVHSGEVWFDAVGKYNPAQKRKAMDAGTGADETSEAGSSARTQNENARLSPPSPKAEAQCASSAIEPCVRAVTAAALDAIEVTFGDVESSLGSGRSVNSSNHSTLTAVPESTGMPLERISLYSPEMNLIAETAPAASGTGAPIGHEYVWFAGMPVAQVDHATATTSWTFTDHLATPILQTDGSGSTSWRVEYEPYGNVYEMRVGAERHQPLRFPGQEAQQVGEGGLGVGERAYNINRWYRSGWGRYSQSDPLGVALSEANLFAYVAANPVLFKDPSGLVKIKQGYQRLGPWTFAGIPIPGEGDYTLFYNKAYTNGKCVGCTGGWRIELSLFYMHGYYCTGDRACKTELHHATIASPYVAKAAQTFNEFEQKVYENKEECNSAAEYFAERLKKYMMNPNGWPDDVKRGFWDSQNDYEDTHHEGLCGVAPWLCAR